MLLPLLVLLLLPLLPPWHSILTRAAHCSLKFTDWLLLMLLCPPIALHGTLLQGVCAEEGC